MFGGGSSTPYDDIVTKTTDENLTTENWELILNLCDKVQDEGETGARDVIASILKRLAHRNPNVQLYALSLVEALGKNCGIEVHREIASRAFTQGLEKLITDRNTHDKVRRRALGLIAMWTTEFENDSQLGVMEDCYHNLKAKNYTFETPQEPPPPDVDDEIRRKEEEELQRVLEMSITDKGGRDAYRQWESYGSSSGSGSSSNLASGSSGVAGSSSASTATYTGYGGGSGPGYVPAPERSSSLPPQPEPSVSTSAPAAKVTTSSSSSDSGSTLGLDNPIVTRVRALHTFEPSEPGELGFQKGDVIKVVDRGYKDWWRGQLKGRTGIFPVNYVEPMPEPTAAELAREAEQEAEVFAQAVNVEKLLTMLRALDPQQDNLADNEEIQELYRQSMTLRPRIVKLIDKYSQKRADLVSMNETFIRARSIFERMMEESLARHTGVYEHSYRPPSVSMPSYGPDPRARADYGTSPPPGSGYGAGPGWSAGPQGGYAQIPHAQPAYSAAPAPYNQQLPQSQPPAAYGQTQPQPQPIANAYGAQPQQQQQSQQQQPYGAQPQQGQPGQYTQQQGPQPYPAVQQQPSQPEPQQTQPQSQQQQQQQQQQQPVQQQQSVQQNTGPPYVYNPQTTYADPNVQAWAQYYAQGGTDPTGSVYFISVPGVKEAQPPVAGSGASQTQGQNGIVVAVDTVQAQPHGQPQQAYQPQQQPTASPQQQQVSSPTASTHASQQQSSRSMSSESLPYPGPERSDSLPFPGGPASGSTSSLGTYASAQQTIGVSPYQQQPAGTTAGPSPYGVSPYQTATAAVTPYQQPTEVGVGPSSPFGSQPQQSAESLHSAHTVGGIAAQPIVGGSPYQQQPAGSAHSLPHQPQPSSPVGSVRSVGGATGGVQGQPQPSLEATSPYHPNTSTPSWVLPKMDSSARPGFGVGGLQGQMGGMSIAGEPQSPGSQRQTVA
ncbi:hypothetical protein VNI00_009162 [Paramarasmius palmivorus]|uniref:Class E vacuolar protein-sorting machinery protein HSE1 n=1 Tax=Paramarasmius palmivorus TaxID=297713 RepID=A0AAW0CU12_9AGAR